MCYSDLNLAIFGVFPQNSSYWRISGSIKNIFEVDKWFWRTAWKHNLSTSYEISSQVSKWSRTQLLAIKVHFAAVCSFLNTCCWISCNSPHASRSCCAPLLPPQHSRGTGSPSSVLPWAAFARGAASSKLKPRRLRRHLQPFAAKGGHFCSALTMSS